MLRGEEWKVCGPVRIKHHSVTFISLIVVIALTHVDNAYLAMTNVPKSISNMIIILLGSND